MKLSVKARYGLAATVLMAQSAGEQVTLARLSERLNISKIYLEQVFSLLKRGGVVSATKGAQGGYQLCAAPERLTALDVLAAIEAPLFEPTEPIAEGGDSPIEHALQALLFAPLDAQVRRALAAVSIAEIAERAAESASHDNFMFYL